jgi:endonuclease YncB( thermonuclease family)
MPEKRDGGNLCQKRCSALEEKKMADRYESHMSVLRVIDGDTLEVEVSPGYGFYLRPITYRLARIDCPKPHGPTKEAGEEATAYTQAWCSVHATHSPRGHPLMASTEKTDDWRRYLAEITCPADGANLSDDLLTSNHAVLYEKRRA